MWKLHLLTKIVEKKVFEGDSEPKLTWNHLSSIDQEEEKSKSCNGYDSYE
jgi:hypothetical protein